jgi:hypothetical protein
MSRSGYARRSPDSSVASPTAATCCDACGTSRSENRCASSTRCCVDTMPTTAGPGTSAPCRKGLEPWRATGAKGCAVGVVKGVSRGRYATGSRHDFRDSDRGGDSPIGHGRRWLCGESIAEARRAGNPLATCRGSRRWATASGDPVGEVARPLPIPIIATRGCQLYCWTRTGRCDSAIMSCHLSLYCGGVTGNDAASSTL